MNIQTSSRTLAPKHVGRHAIVIGGSMGGLLAARVLSDYFEQVTIVDHDIFPTTPDHRKGVPQSHHAHALLASGQYVINHLFPRIMDDLRADGALSVSDVVPYTEVIDLLSTLDHTRVIGVQTRERGQMDSTNVLNADLVVDASGRHSRSSS